MRNDRRRRILLAAVAAMLSAGLSAMGPVPASAHPTYTDRIGYVAQGPSYTACAWQAAYQSHGGGVYSRQIQTGYIRKTTFCPATTSTGSTVVDPGWIIQRGSVYKTSALGQPGQVCAHGGWQPNEARSSSRHWITYEDMWPWCNNGWGVPVFITHDVTSGVWIPSNNAYTVGAHSPFPTTYHQH